MGPTSSIARGRMTIGPIGQSLPRQQGCPLIDELAAIEGDPRIFFHLRRERDHAPTFHKTTPPNAKQQQALDLLETISV